MTKQLKEDLELPLRLKQLAETYIIRNKKIKDISHEEIGYKIFDSKEARFKNSDFTKLVKEEADRLLR